MNIKNFEKDLKNKQNYGKISYDSFKTDFDEEKDFPVQVKNNSPWVKEIYKGLKKYQNAATGAEKNIMNTTVANFEKEADEIYKLDTAGRENLAIKEYMKEKYNIASPIGFELKKQSEKKASIPSVSITKEKNLNINSFAKTASTIDTKKETRDDEEEFAKKLNIPRSLDWDGDGRVDTAADYKRFDQNNNNIADWREKNRKFSSSDEYSYRQSKILNVPYVSQEDDPLCWAAVASMALEFLTGKKHDIYDIEEDYMDFVINEKNWPEPDNTTLSRLSKLLFERGYLKNTEYEVIVNDFGEEKPTFEQMKKSIDDGMPILISFRGNPGHAYIVIGYAGDNGKGTDGLIVFDPNSGKKSKVPMEIIDNETFQDKKYGVGFLMFKRK